MEGKEDKDKRGKGKKKSGAGDVVHLVQSLASIPEALDLVPSTTSNRMMGDTGTLSVWGVEAGRSGPQGHSWLHSESETILVSGTRKCKISLLKK